MKLQLKRSNVLNSGAAKEPTASQLEYGELAINYNTSDPAIFLKDSNNNVIRISGVGNIADDGQVELPATTTPPSNPLAGNLWYNSEDGRLYIYYEDADTSQWVDASPDSWDPTSYPDLTNSSPQANTLDDRYFMLNAANDPITGNVNINGNINLDTSGSATFSQTVTANAFSGPLTGNVTGNVTGNLTGNADTATRATDADNADLLGNQAKSFYRNASNLNAGTLSDDRLPATISSNITGSSASCTGNAATATRATDADDADLLGGQNSAYYRNASNINAGTIGDARLPGTISSNITGSSASCTGNAATATVADKIERNGIQSSSSSNYRVLLGPPSNTPNNALVYVVSDATRLYYNPSTNTLDGLSQVNANCSTATTATSAGNADTVDNLQASQFLRSDADDTATGTITFNGLVNIRADIDLADNDILRFGSGDDAEFFCNGSHMYMDLNDGIGNFYIRDNTTTRFTFNDAGSLTCASNITAYSDISLKENIETIPNALDKVLALRGVGFNRKDIKDKPRQIGVIAQEIEEVIPEVVITGEEGIKSVAYGNLVGLFIESIKELKAEVDALKAQVEG